MSENSATRRDVLKTTGSLAAAGSMIATAGCLGGGDSESGTDLDGNVTVQGPAENVEAEAAPSETDAGYTLEITLSNGSESPVNVSGEIVWVDGNGDNVDVTGMGTNTVDAGGETVLEVDVQDPEDAITRYSATIVAAPA